MEDTEKLLILATAVGKLKDQVKGLTAQADVIQKLEGPQGPKGDKGDTGLPGINGRDGRDGKDGKDGLNGKDGLDGKDGVSVVDAEVAADGSLVLKLSSGDEIDAGPILSDRSAASSVVVQQYAGPRIYVQSSEPVGASVGDIWFDIS